MTPLTLRPPAKLNLGLEITGRRPDGFHDLVTVFQAIDIRDALELSIPENVAEPSWTDFSPLDPTLPQQDNLVVKAVDAIRAATRCTLPIQIRLRKSIPAAAGLGGASSDAAATLRGLDRLWRLSLSDGGLMTSAGGLGSAVPFFLHGGCALGLGRGERLRSLPAVDAWFVVVYPADQLPLERKTAAMFGALRQADFSDGGRVRAQANRLDAGLPLDPSLLENTFARPLYDLAPDLRTVRAALRDAGAPEAPITGSGPTHYAVVATEEEANRIAEAFSFLYVGDASVYVCRSCVN